MTKADEQYMSEIHCLETILNWQMTDTEAKAYKICCLYQDLTQQIFPGDYHYKAKKGDPRKSILFKYCYKLIRETHHKLKDCEYSYYVRSQLVVLKGIKGRDGSYASVQPGCLVGEKAWRRWLLWKNRLQKAPSPLDTTIWTYTSNLALI